MNFTPTPTLNTPLKLMVGGSNSVSLPKLIGYLNGECMIQTLSEFSVTCHLTIYICNCAGL